MKKAAIHFFLIATYAMLLSLGSLTPGSPSEPWFPHVDKFWHMGAYAAFALICAPLWWRLGDTKQAVFGVLLLLFLFSGAMELGQTLVPNREASWLDMLANSIGLLMGWQVSNGIKKARKLRALVAY